MNAKETTEFIIRNEEKRRRAENLWTAQDREEWRSLIAERGTDDSTIAIQIADRTVAALIEFGTWAADVAAFALSHRLGEHCPRENGETCGCCDSSTRSRTARACRRSTLRRSLASKPPAASSRRSTRRRGSSRMPKSKIGSGARSSVHR